jgi:hypothetical protein
MNFAISHAAEGIHFTGPFPRIRRLACAVAIGAVVASVLNATILALIPRSDMKYLRLAAILKAARNERNVNSRALYIVRSKNATSHPSRFDVPWDRVRPLRTKTLAESSNRFLYSPTSPLSTDGIGHAMAQVNAEVTTALTLGITYTHRVASFGSLTSGSNMRAVEEFFGWGHGEVLQSTVQRDVCNITQAFASRAQVGANGKMSAISIGRLCPLCRTLQSSFGKDKTTLHAARAVDIPFHLSYSPKPTCKQNKNSLDECAADYMARVNGTLPNTIFRMSETGCGTLSALTNFVHSAPWFYTKYWEAHGFQWSAESRKWLPRQPYARDSISFSASDLTIAVHVRRGDFLLAKNRRCTSSKVFARIIKSFQDVVQGHGGKFAQLPVAVYIYSEGRPRLDDSSSARSHDVRKRTHDFVDIGGIVRNSSWWETLIHDAKPQNNDMVSVAEYSPPISVHMRISADTLTSLHEMAAADLFIGSDSGMSWNVIGSLGRGMQLHAKDCSDWMCFNNTSGNFNLSLFAKKWEEYVNAFDIHTP